jgi:hypothetical protein
MIETIQHDISIEAITVAVIMYGIVRAIWFVIKFCERRLQTEVGRVIDRHVKSGHKDRFKHCGEGSCATPELGIAPDSLHQVMHLQQ